MPPAVAGCRPAPASAPPAAAAAVSRAYLQWECPLRQPLSRDFAVAFLNLDANCASAEPFGGNKRGAASHKRIERLSFWHQLEQPPHHGLILLRRMPDVFGAPWPNA